MDRPLPLPLPFTLQFTVYSLQFTDLHLQICLTLLDKPEAYCGAAKHLQRYTRRCSQSTSADTLQLKAYCGAAKHLFVLCYEIRA